MLSKVIISLAITTLVSILAGLLVISKFWIVFSLVFILQVLFFYFFNTIYENRLIAKAQQLKIQQFREENKNVVTLQCPCAEKIKQDVDIRFDKDIVYECASCKKNIKAIPDVKTILTTEPIYRNE
jgi:hypothetical protein